MKDETKKFMEKKMKELGFSPASETGGLSVAILGNHLFPSGKAPKPDAPSEPSQNEPPIRNGQLPDTLKHPLTNKNMKKIMFMLSAKGKTKEEFGEEAVAAFDKFQAAVAAAKIEADEEAKKTASDPLYGRALEIVRSRIGGARKGSDAPASEHSVRVGRMLEKAGLSRETVLAGLLHDTIEDGGMTLAELAREGFDRRTLEIVDLCTHDPRIENKDARWTMMITELTEARDADAWSVKLADILDNLMDSYALAQGRERFMREVKVPVILKATERLLGNTELWLELERVHKAIDMSVEEIAGAVSNLRLELEGRSDLPDGAMDRLEACCDKVASLNRGVGSAELAGAIGELREAIAEAAKDLKDPDHRLVALSDGLCGDMLASWKTGDDVRSGLRANET